MGRCVLQGRGETGAGGAANGRRDAVAIPEGVLGQMAAQAAGGSGGEPVTYGLVGERGMSVSWHRVLAEHIPLRVEWNAFRKTTGIRR